MGRSGGLETPTGWSGPRSECRGPVTEWALSQVTGAAQAMRSGAEPGATHTRQGHLAPGRSSSRVQVDMDTG